MNILVVCKWNRFRSRVAEAFFKKYKENKKMKIKSAGAIEGHLPLEEWEVKIAKEFEINIKGRPKGLSSKLLRWSDLVVIVADDVPASLFSTHEKKYNKKVLVWKIRDNKNNSKKEIKRIIKEIETKVKNFVKELG